MRSVAGTESTAPRFCSLRQDMGLILSEGKQFAVVRVQINPEAKPTTTSMAE
jgi:hypothetical protein